LHTVLTSQETSQALNSSAEDKRDD